MHLPLPAVLPLVATASAAYGDPPLAAALARDWCRDILAAVGHCVGCGVYFRYLPLDQVVVLSCGRAVLCGLGGAVLATSAAVADRDNDKDKDKEKEKAGKGSGSGAGAGGGGGDGGGSAGGLPSLVTTAPEVVLGAAASPASSVWAAGAVCAHIITGKPMVKAGSEDKYIQVRRTGGWVGSWVC